MKSIFYFLHQFISDLKIQSVFMDIKWYTKIFIRYPFTYIHFIKSKRVLRNSRQEKYTIIKMSNIKRSFTLQLSVGECRLLVSLQSRWSWFCICHPSPAKEWSPSAGAPRLWLLRDQEVLCQQSIKLPLDGGVVAGPRWWLYTCHNVWDVQKLFTRQPPPAPGKKPHKNVPGEGTFCCNPN